MTFFVSKKVTIITDEKEKMLVDSHFFHKEVELFGKIMFASKGKKDSHHTAENKQSDLLHFLSQISIFKSHFNPFPNKKILGCSKLKEFADDNFKIR